MSRNRQFQPSLRDFDGNCSLALSPALKRWAILNRPFGTKEHGFTEPLRNHARRSLYGKELRNIENLLSERIRNGIDFFQDCAWKEWPAVAGNRPRPRNRYRVCGMRYWACPAGVFVLVLVLVIVIVTRLFAGT